MVKICFSQIDVEPSHPDLNVERMLQAIDEAKQNNTDIIRSVQFQCICCLCQSEHNHLERNNHGKYKQII